MTPADQDGAQARLVSAPALPRLTAFALDAVTYLIIPALLLPLGLLLIRHGVMLSSAAVNAIGLVLVIAPATAWATWCEAPPREATLGKRLLRLGVLAGTTEALVPASRSLARNVIKIALPWELGSYMPSGKPLLDRLAGTVVVRTRSDHRLRLLPSSLGIHHRPGPHTGQQRGDTRLVKQVAPGSLSKSA